VRLSCHHVFPSMNESRLDLTWNKKITERGDTHSCPRTKLAPHAGTYRIRLSDQSHAAPHPPLGGESRVGWTRVPCRMGSQAWIRTSRLSKKNSLSGEAGTRPPETRRFSPLNNATCASHGLLANGTPLFRPPSSVSPALRREGRPLSHKTSQNLKVRRTDCPHSLEARTGTQLAENILFKIKPFLASSCKAETRGISTSCFGLERS